MLWCKYPTRFVSLVLAVAGVVSVAADVPQRAPTSPGEPLAPKFSLARSTEYLDSVALDWTHKHHCGSCHTNYSYLLARPFLKETTAAHEEVRKFFELRAANWDTGKKEDRPRWDTEVVATGVVLAFHDAHTTGRLHPLTRKALDKMWTLQKPHGAWDWLKCDWPPMEHDDYFGATFAAVGVGAAPDRYAQTEAARQGLAKLRKFFLAHRPPDLHHKTWLLWASLPVEGLMTPAEREATIKELLALQHADGGWCLPSLGDWKRRDGSPNDKGAPSDGYATGLIVYVLRQTGMAAPEEPLQRGVAWLKANQRESGRWFTRSLNDDKAHYIADAGTSFAVMALAACGETD
jgi:squalene-hopene/tetraprenyl-beta-curcumene cyclase